MKTTFAYVLGLMMLASVFTGVAYATPVSLPEPSTLSLFTTGAMAIGIFGLYRSSRKK